MGLYLKANLQALFWSYLGKGGDLWGTQAPFLGLFGLKTINNPPFERQKGITPIFQKIKKFLAPTFYFAKNVHMPTFQFQKKLILP